jgi:hypothetical protein
MTSGSAAFDEFYPSGCHVEIIMNNQQVVRKYFKKSEILSYSLAASIHKGKRLDNMQILSQNGTGSIKSLPFFPASLLPPTRCQLIDNQKSDIMTSRLVVFAGVAESDDQEIVSHKFSREIKEKGPEKFTFPDLLYKYLGTHR